MNDEDEWVDVSDDLPMVELGRKQLSVEVIAKTEIGEEIKAFYAHENRCWCRADTIKRIKENIVSWKSL